MFMAIAIYPKFCLQKLIFCYLFGWVLPKNYCFFLFSLLFLWKKIEFWWFFCCLLMKNVFWTQTEVWIFYANFAFFRMIFGVFVLFLYLAFLLRGFFVQKSLFFNGFGHFWKFKLKILRFCRDFAAFLFNFA